MNYIYDINEHFEIEVEVETRTGNSCQKVEANEAVTVFNKALLEWAENACIDQNEIDVLRRLREKVLLQILEKGKQHEKIIDFFNK